VKIKSNELIEDIKIIEFDIHKDNRGQFSRIFCQKEFEEVGIFKPIVQMNHSFTKTKGSVRGMHYQLPPTMESKYVRCISGEVFDVVIDLRRDSKTFLKWTSIHLKEDQGLMVYIPEGFAHGFQTLTDNAELIYLHSEYYEPKAERGIHHLDPLVNIKWPLEITDVSERDFDMQKIDNNFKGLEI